MNGNYEYQKEVESNFLKIVW